MAYACPAARDADGEARSIRFGTREIPYTLRRSSRRSLGMQIDQRGLVVTIPMRVSVREAEAFMRERGAWIVEKLAVWEARPVPQAPTLHDGMSLPVLGEPCRVSWLAGANRVRWIEGLGGRELHLHLRRQEDARTVLLRGLQQYALNYFAGRMDEYGYLLARIAPGVSMPTVRLTNARTRWGSCSLRSGIRLNWRLVHLPRVQVDYVVAHEVAHLLEMNHSPRFWDVVAQLMPDYEVAKNALRHANKIIPAL